MVALFASHKTIMSRQLTINKNKKTTMAALPTNPNRKKKLSLSSSTSSGSGSKDDDEVIVEKTVKGKGKPCKAMGRGDCGHLGVTVKHKCIDCGEGVHNKLPCGVPVGGGKYRCDWCTQEKDSNDGKKDDSEAETGSDGEAFDYVIKEQKRAAVTQSDLVDEYATGCGECPALGYRCKAPEGQQDYLLSDTCIDCNEPVHYDTCGVACFDKNNKSAIQCIVCKELEKESEEAQKQNGECRCSVPIKALFVS